MATGIGFMDILVNEVTMVIGAAIFLVSLLLLIFKRNALCRITKVILVVLLLLCAVYLAFILWAVVMWGGSPEPAAALY